MEYPRIVYAIRHNPTKKIYVGSTSEPKMRIYGHLLQLRNGVHYNRNMQEDCDKFGHDYSVFILDIMTSWHEGNKEYRWMDIFHTRNPEYGYNDRDHTCAGVPSLEKMREYKITRTDKGGYDLKKFSEDASNLLSVFSPPDDPTQES